MRLEQWMRTIGADAIDRWKRGGGYDVLEGLIARDETIDEVMRRTPTTAIDTAAVVASILIEAYEKGDDDGATTLLLSEANASAASQSLERFAETYTRYLDGGGEPIRVRTSFDPISFQASNPRFTRTNAERIDPENATLVLLARGALLPGYELASYLELPAQRIVPILYSRHKLEQNTPHITAFAHERLTRAERIVLFDEDVQSGATLRSAASALSAYGVPIKAFSNVDTR